MEPGMRTGWPALASPGGALAVHAQPQRAPADLMGFDLGEVVRDVIDKFQLDPGDGGEHPAGCLGEQLAVGARVVGGGRHRAEVGPALRGADGCAGELPVGHDDAVAGHRGVHHPDVITAYLVAQTPGPAVDHHADLAPCQPKSSAAAGSKTSPTTCTS